MIKFKRLNVGFYITLLSFISAVVSLIMFMATYSVFKYSFNRWVFFMTFLSIWAMGFMLVNTFLVGDKPFWVSYVYVLISVMLVLSLVKFINPCLSPIGIYFTVHNMGDVETNAIGVPYSLVTAGFYLVAIISNLVASFLPSVKKDKRGNV